MKRLFLIYLAVLMLFIAGCGEKYSDAVEVHREFLAAMNNYIDNIDKADSAQKMAAAMEEFADAMAGLGPRINEINIKYPELKDESNQPEALKEIQRESDAMEKQFSESFMKIMQYMNDPEVQKAHQKIAASMRTMADK